MSYKTVITNLGLAKIATALANSETISLATMEVGDGNGNPVEDPSVIATELVRSVWSGSLSYLDVDPENPNRFIAEAVIPSTEGAWTVREVGIFDSEGDLIVNANFPEVYKPLPAEGSTRDLVIRVYFEVTNADTIELSVDASVIIASRAWVESNFNLVALLPGGTTGQVLRKASNADGDTEWFDPTTGLNLIVDVVEEQQTLAAAQTVVTLAVAGTDGASYYVEGIRLHPGDYTVNSATQITLAEAYPAGSKILACQNDPGTGFSFLQQANNLSDLASKRPARVNLGFPDAADASFMETLWKSLMVFQYPVGEILTTRRTGNPSSWLGFGTWERYGAGRALVSLDEADASFNQVDLTGGAKTHTLTVNELPSHFHNIDPPATNTSSGGNHEHFIAHNSTGTGSSGTVGVTASNYATAAADRTGVTTYEYALSGTASEANVGLTSAGGTHSHSLDIAAFNSASSGGGLAHNNLQPYIVINVWKRTA